MQTAKLLRRLFSKTQPPVRISKRGYKFEPTTYDDMPNPKGDFNKLNNALQAKYNIQLALGIGSLIVSIAAGIPLGQYDFWNHYPPRDLLPEIDNYQESSKEEEEKESKES